MIVREDIYNVPTAPVVKMAERDKKKFLIVNNHVREIPIQYETNTTNNEENTDHSLDRSNEQKLKRKTSKRKNNGYFHQKNEDNTCEDSKSSDENTKICESDLEELRTVYKNCKAVIEKIEMKYGHLLDLDCGVSSKTHKRKHKEESDKCRCEKNKKIVFDDDGQQITVDTIIENHICPKKPKEIHKPRSIEIEYTDETAQLPDNLQDLLKLLQNPNIESTFRYEVIHKIKSMKEEVLNEIKFNKHSLIEKLKKNPDVLLAFEGTNLASLPGYP